MATANLPEVCGYDLPDGFCRTHHRVKQEPGWHVTQPTPGWFQITTPTGRTYTVGPDTYQS